LFEGPRGIEKAVLSGCFYHSLENNLLFYQQIFFSPDGHRDYPGVGVFGAKGVKKTSKSPVVPETV
jgi:hypothetical protein